MATAGAEAATVAAASAVVVGSMGEVSLVAVSMVVGSAGEASAVALSTAVVVSVVAVSAVVVSTAVAFVAAVLMVALSTAVAFVGAVSTITDSLMMCSSAASAFPAGGAGTIRTDITVTAITRTVTMDTVGIHTATKVTGGMVTTVAWVIDVTMEAERVMAMAAEPAADNALAVDQGISRVRELFDKPGYGS